MPAVIDDTDILEHTSTSPDYADVQALPRVLPSARRGHATLFAALRGLFTSLTSRRQLRTHREQHCVSGMPEFELPMDLVARQYPHIYLRIMSWSI